MPGFAAYLGKSLTKDGHASILLNLGSLLSMASSTKIPASEFPYVVAECLAHEVFHVLEEWAGVEFSEDRVEALVQKYNKKYAAKGRNKKKVTGTGKDKRLELCAMAIVHHVGESLKAGVGIRQDTNDANIDFAMEKIRELLTQVVSDG